MTDNESVDENKSVKNELNGSETPVDMSASMAEIMNSSQHENITNDLGQHKLSVASSLNGLDDGNATAQKQSSATAKLELMSKEKLIQLIRKQLLAIKEARKTATDNKNEAETLRQQLTDLESKAPKGSDSLLALELSDYKKGMEALRQKCQTADKELSEKDGMLKDLGVKLHTLSEQNATNEETVKKQGDEISSHLKRIEELERLQSSGRSEFEQQQGELQSQLDTLTKDHEESLETVRKLRKDLKSIRNQGTEDKLELNQLQKSRQVLQKTYEDLKSEFDAYKEKATFVLNQQTSEKQKANESFEIEELERQLKHKNEQINQLNQRSLGLQQEINSAQDRCKMLRTELEDARQSMGMTQKSMAEERRKLSNEYEQRIKQLTKELDDNKREILQIQEQAMNERQKQEEINTRLITDLNSQIRDLQLKLSQSTKDSSVGNVQDSKQKPKEREPRRLVNPINFETETRFSMEEIAKSSNEDKSDILNSLNDLINNSESAPESSYGLMRTNSRGSLNSWTDPEELERQLQHTRSILREAEQTNAKLEAQVDLLKKELRRNESNNVSVQHINQNMNYFKNVMLKFLAPEKVNDGRAQMLPVLATMLSLCPEEVKSIENALKAQEERQVSEFAGYFGPLSGIF